MSQKTIALAVLESRAVSMYRTHFLPELTSRNFGEYVSIINREDDMGFRITLQPGNHTFTAKAGETILEAATRHGHKLPRGCGDGACGLCKGHVLQGTVDHGRATEMALSAEERGAGVALFCCAIPTSDLVIEPRDWGMLAWDTPMD